MPSKAAQLIAFFFVLLVSVALHRYVYKNLKRLIQRDYLKTSQRIIPIARVFFIAMDSPFLFLFFRSRINAELTTISRVVLYPFSVWQAVMLMWVIVLVPFSLWRRRHWLAIPLLAEPIRRAFGKGNVIDENEEEFQPELEVAPDRT
ncbi:MAG TPA: hypothetical protein VG537_06235 [Candidatus Kapabacteria bacterium]|nr:hypothetical protein [Candidatus Kapabacteria bacterium]